MSRAPAPECPVCAARRAQARRASAAAVAARRLEAAEQDRELQAALEPLLRRVPDLSASGAARRLVAFGVISPEDEDRARRLAGRLRRTHLDGLAATAGRVPTGRG